MSSIHPINFFVSTLRAPVLVSDTQLQLASGSTAPLNVIASGDFVYLTVSDGTTVEVMKYISTGSIVADTIIVVRAQDNTTAKAFPVGSCVAIGWNVLQIETLITEFITGDVTLPVNTQVITGSNSVPSGTPSDNVIYTINTTTGQAWYWNGVSWILIVSNNLQLMAGDPSAAPAGGILWTFNILTASLFFWDGSTSWILVSGTPGYMETLLRQYLDPDVGVALPVGTDDDFGAMVTAETIAVTPTYFKAHGLVNGTLSLNGTNQLVFAKDSIVELTATINGSLIDGTKNFMARLALFHTGSVSEYVSQVYVPANTGTAAGINVSTGLLKVLAGDVWDCNLVIIDGGVTYDGLTLTQFDLNATVVAITTGLGIS